MADIAPLSPEQLYRLHRERQERRLDENGPPSVPHRLLRTETIYFLFILNVVHPFPDAVESRPRSCLNSRPILRL